jgi:protein disulfide-isomerase
MKKFSLFFVILMQSITCLCSEESRKAAIGWLTSYEQAVNQSRTLSKPIILFFTGSDWCSWCHKLEDEVLNTPDFAEQTADKFIFVKLDFPMHTTLDSALTAQNQSLQQKFDVRSFPALVLLDDEEHQIGLTGYRPGGGKQYAAHLFKMVNSYATYRKKIQNLDKQKLSGADLRQLYDKAKDLGIDNDLNAIIKAGIDSDEKHYFSIERYRFLADEGQIHQPEAVGIRQRLLNADPRNEQLTHYHIAVIDFESCCEEAEKEHLSPDATVAPLIDYISKFGSKDKDNLWRLEMIVSQVYLDKNNIAQAIKYAKASYETAPPSVQPQIGIALKNIQLQNK